MDDFRAQPILIEMMIRSKNILNFDLLEIYYSVLGWQRELGWQGHVAEK